jgi:hypothetical protein
MLVMLGACTTQAGMSRHDIDNMKANCANQQEQIAFLQRQYPDKNEELTNGMILTSSLGLVSSVADGTYTERREMFDGAYSNAVRLKIRQIREQCAR